MGITIKADQAKPLRWPTVLVALLTAWLLSGCSYLLASATQNVADGLTSGILDQNDPEIIRQGAPAYFLLIDGLIKNNPKNEQLLRSGAGLYGSYAAAFIEDPARSARLTNRAWDYAKRALCARHRDACNMDERPFEEFAAYLTQLNLQDVPTLYTYGSAWAGWIESHQDDWTGIANIPKVKVIMQRIVELNENYDNGGAHLYLGVLSTLLPPTLGGKPEQALAHLERALDLCNGQNLMVKVVIAERYARLLFDRELHDTLLNEVLETKSDYPGFTLTNVLAQERARKLLRSADDYF